MAEARTLLATTGREPPGPYQLQAAIALVHAVPGPDGPAWPAIAELYAALDRVAPSPVVTVNRAVAVGRAEGADAGLAVLAPVLADARLARYAPMHAAHAALLEPVDAAAARAAWRRAAQATGNAVQRARLARRASTTSE